MGRSRRKHMKLDPEVLRQGEEILDKQREYLFSESARRLRKEKGTEREERAAGRSRSWTQMSSRSVRRFHGGPSNLPIGPSSFVTSSLA